MPEKQSQALADALPAARLQSIAGAGHMLALEKPLEVCAAIESALAGWAGG